MGKKMEKYTWLVNSSTNSCYTRGGMVRTASQAWGGGGHWVVRMNYFRAKGEGNARGTLSSAVQ